jgi:hypothetical protein
MAARKTERVQEQAKANTMPRNPGRVSKAAFVRGLPSAMPVAEVVSRAKKAGLEITANHVSAIRSEERSQKATAAKKGLAKKRAAASAPVAASPRAPAKPAERTSPRPSGLEAQLLQLMLDVGLRRTKELVARLEEISRKA